jgi:DUF4097 and DUF4098 domain-containing protein YvlB
MTYSWIVAVALAASVVNTDRTVPVQPGTRLDLDHFAGDVIIRTWDRNEVRVVAEHSDRERIDIATVQSVLRVRSSSKRGPGRAMDVTLTVPKWMPIAVEGVYIDVSIEGTQADITVETVGGEVTVRGGAGTITLNSVQGDVVLEQAKGKITVGSVNEGVRVVDVEGDITAETTNGSIDLLRVRSAAVEAASVNGTITYDGGVVDGGRYQINTHNGAINMAMPETANASVNVRTYSGNFRTNLAVKPTEVREGRRYELTLGKGSARVNLESFQGSVSLLKPGTLPERRDPKAKGKG